MAAAAAGGRGGVEVVEAQSTIQRRPRRRNDAGERRRYRRRRRRKLILVRIDKLIVVVPGVDPFRESDFSRRGLYSWSVDKLGKGEGGMVTQVDH